MIVFLPQILILFLFILLLEATGYMVRAAFLMDRLMAKAGLSGHAFIPLLSSFACAIPGIMATRTIEDPQAAADHDPDRAADDLLGAAAGLHVDHRRADPGPDRRRRHRPAGPRPVRPLRRRHRSARCSRASILRKTVTKGEPRGFIMEMPKYQMPHVRDILLGLWQRALIFLKRAGGIILVSTIVLWALLSFPQPPAGRIGARRLDRRQARLGPRGRDAADRLQPRNLAGADSGDGGARSRGRGARDRLFDRRRDDEAAVEQSLGERLQGRWSLPTALAFLAWFVFAPQCLSTVAVTRRETNGWKWPLFMLGYLFVLAYVAAGATYLDRDRAGL